MELETRGIPIALGALIFCGPAAAEWRCDCTNIVGSCQASAIVRESSIEITSNVEQCSRVDYLVDGTPLVALVVEGSERQDWIARSEAPSVIVQSCQVCRDNASTNTEPAPQAGAGLASQGEVTRLIEVAPDYPPAAAAAGIEGYVDVRFSISPSGTVIDPQVVAAKPEGVFEEAALAAVARWRYTRPAADARPSLTERIEFNIADEILSLNARRGRSQVPAAAVATARNDCIREESRYDFGEMVNITLINACNAPLIVYSCSTGTGAHRERWICENGEQAATVLQPSSAPSGGTLSIETPEGERPFTRSSRLEITRAPNSEYWWLACAVGDAACRVEGRGWVRSMDEQVVSIDPQDRTSARLARSF
jgi:TonB family protein